MRQACLQNGRSSRPVAWDGQAGAKTANESAKKLFMEHLELGTFSALAPPPGRPANITPTLHGNGSFSHSTRSHRVWMHMDEAIPHARARRQIMCCAVHAVQR